MNPNTPTTYTVRANIENRFQANTICNIRIAIYKQAQCSECRGRKNLFVGKLKYTQMQNFNTCQTKSFGITFVLDTWYTCSFVLLQSLICTINIFLYSRYQQGLSLRNLNKMSSIVSTLLNSFIQTKIFFI